MPGKSKEQLEFLLRRTNELSLKQRFPPPANLAEIAGWIVRGDQRDRDRAEEALSGWATAMARSAKERGGASPPPTAAQAAVLDSRRAAIAAAASPSPPPPTPSPSASTRSPPPSPRSPAAGPAQASPQAAPRPLGDAVLEFALRAHKAGLQVGNGECWTLANDALASAGASPPSHRGGEGLNFGQLICTIRPDSVADISNARRGDILQYYTTTFRIQRRVGQATSTTTTTMIQHTAIVVSVSGSEVRVVESNVGDVKLPTVNILDFGGLVSGEVKLWRAVPPPPP
jgi:hypothetical protein